jgi:hypothetical protein
MLEIERAGENICGLCAIERMSIGECIGVADEYAGLGTGEPRSEIVRQHTTEGVALTC